MKIQIVAIQFAAALTCAFLPAAAPAQDKMMTPAEYRKVDPAVDRFFKDSAGYVVFPRIGKMGFIIAGGHGEGEMFEKGKVIGTASVGMASIGLQVGIQDFSQIVFFQDMAAVARFKENKFEFTANASAVILAAGAAKGSNYRDGVVVFVHSNSGAMAELSVGTEKFSFKPEGAPPAK